MRRANAASYQQYKVCTTMYLGFFSFFPTQSFCSLTFTFFFLFFILPTWKIKLKIGRGYTFYSTALCHVFEVKVLWHLLFLNLIFELFYTKEPVPSYQRPCICMSNAQTGCCCWTGSGRQKAASGGGGTGGIPATRNSKHKWERRWPWGGSKLLQRGCNKG